MYITVNTWETLRTKSGSKEWGTSQQSNLRLFQHVSYITDIKNYNGGSSKVHMRGVHLIIVFIILTTIRDSVSINHKIATM